MNTRRDRLNEVYEYLRENFGIHTKTQFASALKITQPALSSAMNGNDAYLTDNLFKRTAQIHITHPFLISQLLQHCFFLK